MDIGFIGLGSMGLPMATNLLAAGHKLRIYNRTGSKAEALVKRGAELTSKSAAVATPGGVVITMLADDAALEGVVVGLDTIAHRLAPGGIHISMSTIAPATSRKLAHYHSENGSSYVAAPVFGRPEAAHAKRLWICTSGPQHEKHKIAEILAAMGQKTFDFGEDPGAANTVKLSGNFLIARGHGSDGGGPRDAGEERHRSRCSHRDAELDALRLPCIPGIRQGYRRDATYARGI